MGVFCSPSPAMEVRLEARERAPQTFADVRGGPAARSPGSLSVSAPARPGQHGRRAAVDEGWGSMSAVPGRDSDSQSLQAPFMLSDIRVQPPDGPGETGPLELGPQNGEGERQAVKPWNLPVAQGFPVHGRGGCAFGLEDREALPFLFCGSQNALLTWLFCCYRRALLEGWAAKVPRRLWTPLSLQLCLPRGLSPASPLSGEG